MIEEREIGLGQATKRPNSYLISLPFYSMGPTSVPLIGSPGDVYGVILLALVFWLLIPLLVSRWIYRDATKRGRDHALAWAIGAFASGVTTFVVLLLYLTTRESDPDG